MGEHQHHFIQKEREMRKTVAVSLALGLLGLGCGGGSGGGGSEGPAPAPGTVSPTSATAGAQQASLMLDAVNSGNGDTMTSTAFSFGLSGMTAVTPKALTVAPEGDVKSLEHSALRPDGIVSEVKKILADANACSSGTRTCDMNGCV